MAKYAPKILKYKIFPPVGPDSFSAEGDVADLLFDIPYFFLARIVPPKKVVNEVLRKGVVDAGMSGGCKWKPFKLDDASYAKLADHLRRMEFSDIQPPDWVNTHSDWHMWCAELVWGIPAIENRRQSAEIHELDVKRNAAIERGDEELASSLLMKITDLCLIYSRFVSENRIAKPKMPIFHRPMKKRKLRQGD